jgi:beta-glucosidase
LIINTLVAAPAQAAGEPWMNTAVAPSERADLLVAAMTSAEKLTMLHGGASCGHTGCVNGNTRLGIPALRLQDGPVGVGGGLTGVTQLAAPVAGAASWDSDLMRAYGETLGAEQWGKGSNVVLAPTINIVRDARWGRAFESFGEDPYLAGRMAVANIRGIQSQGPMAQVKHYAVYNQETRRNTAADNAIVSDRTEREIYLPAFEMSVKDAAADSTMCSYSAVNGPFACENGPLLNQILKAEWGFTGFVTADWGATHSTVPSANNGLDMEMPGSQFFGAPLTTAVNNGQVSQATLNDHVRRILTSMFTRGLFDRPQTGTVDATVTTPEHVALARRVAADGSVLLKNDNAVLPVGAAVRSIAVLGAGGSSAPLYQGGGSARVNPSGSVSPLAGIQSRAPANVTVTSATTHDAAVAAARTANLAVVFVTKSESEGSDLANLDLAADQNQLVTDVAAVNPNTVVVINSGSAVTMPWLGSVRGVIEAWYPGQQYGNALAALLFGDVNPAGRLPVTFPRALADGPLRTTAQWPGQNNTVQYSEGLNVGYRWYDRQNITPLFPFGFGLSYTSFAYANLSVAAPDAAGAVAVSFDVTNSGVRAGAEVAQVYVGQPSAAGEPSRNLRGFTKVTLDPGQTRRVTVTLDARSFQAWIGGRWSTAAGAHQILVGGSSRDIRLTGSVTPAGGGGSTVLPRTGWVASATPSSTTDVPARMLDGDTATRWSTGTPMRAGHTVTVDLGGARTFGRVVVDAGPSANDFPRGYQIAVSDDGVTWRQVATGTGTTALVDVTVGSQTARFLRITQTGSATSWWSIAELTLMT